jgi:hypothetical protein
VSPSEVTNALPRSPSIYSVRGRRGSRDMAGPYTVETKQIETVDNDCLALGLTSSLAPR